MFTRQKLLFPFIILGFFTILHISCTHKKMVTPEYTIYGSWVRLITDPKGIQFNAEMKINNDNSFDFILLDNVPGHTNSSAEFTFNGKTITIINDMDCDVDGVYRFVVSEKKLTIYVVSDECVDRVIALRGVWNKK